jgi:phosphoglycolate phosphatase
MTLRGLIFDFDGTLAHLNIDFNAMREEVHSLARRQGYSGPWKDGYLLEEVDFLSKELGDEFARDAASLIENREIEAAVKGSLFPFTLNLLTRIRGLGLGVAIVSRNCGPAIRRVFPDLDRLCEVFLPREAVTEVKPHPGHLLAALKGLRLSSSEAAMVGDHPTDIQAGRAAGCFTVGVTSGRMGPEQLQAAGADLVLPQAEGLLEALALDSH